jgi:hypothetical protein
MSDNIFHGGCNDFDIVRYDLMMYDLVSFIDRLLVDPFSTAIIRQSSSG